MRQLDLEFLRADERGRLRRAIDARDGRAVGEVLSVDAHLDLGGPGLDAAWFDPAHRRYGVGEVVLPLRIPSGLGHSEQRFEYLAQLVRRLLGEQSCEAGKRRDPVRVH